jgi:hypothetical protein
VQPLQAVALLQWEQSREGDNDANEDVTGEREPCICFFPTELRLMEIRQEIAHL